jgi:hypothetical protein
VRDHLGLPGNQLPPEVDGGGRPGDGQPVAVEGQGDAAPRASAMSEAQSRGMGVSRGEGKPVGFALTLKYMISGRMRGRFRVRLCLKPASAWGV